MSLVQQSEPPLRVESREELVYLLGEACELEHGLLCEYLYAQFSLKRGVEEGVSADELTRIQAWEKVLVDIAKQEMLHLALATNILTAIGAAPHFERPNFPILTRWYPPDVQIALVPFGERALRHFMYLERPEGMTLEDAEGFSHAGRFEPLRADDPQLTAGAQEWRTVGHLYRGIEAGLAHLVSRYGESGVFIGPLEAQATTDIFEWPELTAVSDLASARAAIEVIVEQGEGARGDWVESHFGRFVGVLEDFLDLRRANPAFDPSRPVLPAYVHEPPDVEEPVLIDEAYFHFVEDPDYATSIPHVFEDRPVMVTRTFSKIAALAGMRLGYAIAPTEMIRDMRPYATGTINAIVKWGGVAALNDVDAQAKVKKVTLYLRKKTTSELQNLGYTVVPSEANFFFVHIRRTVPPVIDEFKKKGVLVGRPFPPFTEHLRVSVGTADEMSRFLTAFKDVVPQPRTASKAG